MEIKLAMGNVLVEYIGEKKKGHQEVKVIQKNDYVTTVDIGRIYLADVQKATDITIDSKEMAIINVKYIKAEKLC